MKKLTGLLVTALMLGMTAGCGKPAVFSTDLNKDGTVYTLTAENAEKGTQVGSGFTFEEGDVVTIASSITKGSVKVTFSEGELGGGTVVDEMICDGTASKDYQVAPGSYFINFAVEGKGATGTITVTTTSNPAETEAAGTEEDGQNPVMNFVGRYALDRCQIEVQPEGKDGAKFLVSWGSSAAEHSEWEMSGVLDTDTLTVNYTDCVKKNIVLKEDGTVDSETVVYENGKGSFQFDGGSALVWNDEEEHVADGNEYQYVLIVN